jgi:hypothetical protein
MIRRGTEREVTALRASMMISKILISKRDWLV